MAISSVNPPVTGLRKVVTLYSGSSWTVPDGVTYINAKLVGGGGGTGTVYVSGSNNLGVSGQAGGGGQIVETTLITTPGASISYSIGAGGVGSTSNGGTGSPGGTTTMTGATSALGGMPGTYGGNGGYTQPAGLCAGNGAPAMGGNNSSSYSTSNAGGAGCIVIEYFV